MAVCRECARTVKVACKTCKHCAKCGCGCVVCEYCTAKKGREVKHSQITRCDYCGKCRRVCNCHHRNHGHQLPTEALSPEYGGVAAVNKSRRAISVELEATHFFGMDRHVFDSFKYKMVRDGSVAVSGQEMVISGLVGDTVVSAMAEVAMEAEIRGVKYDKTCGLHVHVDSRDLSWWNMRALLLLWDKFSNTIAYPLIHPDRAGNPQCSQLRNHPLWDSVKNSLLNAKTSGEIKKAILKFCGMRFTYDYRTVKERLSALKASKYGVGQHDPTNARYYDLNVYSHIFRGTVEFRSMHMTTDPLELVAWPLICLNLVRLATNKGEVWLKNVTPQQIYKAMPPFVRHYLRTKSTEFVEESVERGITCAV